MSANDKGSEVTANEGLSSSHMLNQAQQLHLRVNCQHMDKLLQDVEGILHAAESKSPFPRYRVDISPANARVLESYISRFRAQLVNTLAWQQMKLVQPAIAATHAVSTHLHFVDIALSDLRPSVMKGSGALSDEAATELSGVVRELGSLIQNMLRYVHHDLKSSLSDRIQSLQTEGQSQALLKRLEEVITRRGMVELRPRLEMLLSRLEDRYFEVAFFGRVSSGKSSLLNALLGTQLLPVGVTPITAVPTRIRFGTRTEAFVSYGNQDAVEVPVEEFRSLVSEKGNPANQRGVTRAMLTVPSPRLSGGIQFIDTPGVGSLAHRGTAETLAYLPSCDLGLVLIDAGHTLSAEDIGTLRMLVEAGIPALVLITKADLLNGSELDSTLAYTREHIQNELSTAIPVRAVSSVDPCKKKLDLFFEGELQPRFLQVEKLRSESALRKLFRLRSDVLTTLQITENRTTEEHGRDAIHAAGLEKKIHTISGSLVKSENWLHDRVTALRDWAPRLIHDVSAEIAIVAEHHSSAVAPLNVAERVSSAMRLEVEEIVAKTQHSISQAVEEICQVGRVLGRSDLPEVKDIASLFRGVPVFTSKALPSALRMGIWNFTPGTINRFRLERAWKGDPDLLLQSELRTYSDALEQWAKRLSRLIDLTLQSFLGSYREAVQAPANPTVPSSDLSAVRHDIELLQSTCTDCIGVRGEA